MASPKPQVSDSPKEVCEVQVLDSCEPLVAVPSSVRVSSVEVQVLDSIEPLVPQPQGPSGVAGPSGIVGAGGMAGNVLPAALSSSDDDDDELMPRFPQPSGSSGRRTYFYAEEIK
ncbi:hypothetical protein JYU34_010520 [Plutella xylostella]|uniref:Uncharacterized protein n=1 Tax=Plutella xylostella TaxID=51655 RepID=A0ABQ7QMA5_PLUXY|nr:hypothetical protein JYU34_010520 [Plutella xylostella]